MFAKVFLRSLASGRGSFVKTASVVPGGFEVAVDSELSTRRVRHERQRIN